MSRIRAFHLVGSTGKLGQAILKLAENKKIFQVLSQISRHNFSSFLSDIPGLKHQTSCIVDVSLPNVSVALLKTLLQAQARVPYIVGCTGWVEGEFELLRQYAIHAPVLFAPNFSLGVTIFIELLELAAERFESLKPKVRIHEVHHTNKRDAPSGTAKALSEIFNRFPHYPHEITHDRMDNVVGIHQVSFETPFEKITLEHEALDRAVFAEGALMAVDFFTSTEQRPGLYAMKDLFIPNTRK